MYIRQAVYKYEFMHLRKMAEQFSDVNKLNMYEYMFCNTNLNRCDRETVI